MPKWNEINALSAEVEMGLLLYGLVRMLKPKLVVETGCGEGWSTVQLGNACRDNNYGRVVSCDTNPDMVKTATTLCNSGLFGFPDEFPVEIRNCSSLELPELMEADFIFSDSNYGIRHTEITFAKKGCVIVVHDTSLESRKYDPSAEWLDTVVKEYGGLTFDAGRGFGILIKP